MRKLIHRLTLVLVAGRLTLLVTTAVAEEGLVNHWKFDGNYKDSVGSHNILYNASLYKEVSKISAISPYVFGTTATPTDSNK